MAISFALDQAVSLALIVAGNARGGQGDSTKMEKTRREHGISLG